MPAAKNELREKLKVQSPKESIDYLNILIYGDSGVGKTYLAGTAQDHEDTKPMLLIDIEGGALTLRHRKDIDVIQARTIKEVVNIHNEIEKADPYYKSVVIDSLTELQKLDMRIIMDEAYNKNPEKVDKDVPSPREWGKSLVHIRMIVRAYRDLPMNTIITALAVTDKGDDSSTVEIRPALPGQQSKEIPGFMDIVGYYHIDGSNRRLLQLQRTRRIMAKDRTQLLGDLIQDPSIPLIYEKLASGS